jgi:hypothetical protein
VVLMSRVPGFPMYQVKQGQMANPEVRDHDGDHGHDDDDDDDDDDDGGGGGGGDGDEYEKDSKDGVRRWGLNHASDRRQHQACMKHQGSDEHDPPLYPKSQRVFPVCVELIVRLARRGLIHCDFNEFNLMITEEGQVTLIDFPQVRALAVMLLLLLLLLQIMMMMEMVMMMIDVVTSMTRSEGRREARCRNSKVLTVPPPGYGQMISVQHPNAKDYFTRDLNCVIKFFATKMRFVPPEEMLPEFEVSMPPITGMSVVCRYEMVVVDVDVHGCCRS